MLTWLITHQRNYRISRAHVELRVSFVLFQIQWMVEILSFNCERQFHSWNSSCFVLLSCNPHVTGNKMLNKCLFVSNWVSRLSTVYIDYPKLDESYLFSDPLKISLVCRWNDFIDGTKTKSNSLEFVSLLVVQYAEYWVGIKRKINIRVLFPTVESFIFWKHASNFIHDIFNGNNSPSNTVKNRILCLTQNEVWSFVVAL